MEKQKVDRQGVGRKERRKRKEEVRKTGNCQQPGSACERVKERARVREFARE